MNASSSPSTGSEVRKKSRPRRSREEMERLLRRKTTEGLTYEQLSRSSGVPCSTLQAWQKRLKESRRSSEPSPAFVQAGVVDSVSPGTTYELVLSSGRSLRVSNGFEDESVQRLLSLLENSC